MTRLFSRTKDGLLTEVSPDIADEARKGRRISSVNMVVDVLFTPEQEAAADAADAEASTPKAPPSTQEKLQAMLTAYGMTVDDLKGALKD